MDKNKCEHAKCLKGKVVAEYLNESSGLFEAVSSCDSCLKELMNFEAGLVIAKAANLKISMESDSPFQEALDIHKAEMLLSAETNVPLPQYLQNYMDSSFAEKEKVNDSIILKITKTGIKYIDSLVENMTLIPSVNYAPAMRSLVADPESYIVLEETTATGTKVTYQVIQEATNEAFLSIKVESEDQDDHFQQANLKKSGRFIQSTRFGEDNTVNFSGLKEGKYNLELTSEKSAKIIDLNILID